MLPMLASSDETGAPQLTNVAGSLNALLHAVLVTGWRVQTLTSLTVAGGVATGTLAGHGYTSMRSIEVAGASTAALNGRKLITVTGSGTFTFPAPGVADGAAAGTIEVRRAGCGWVRTHNGGNASIYARTDVSATSMCLRVLDDAAAPGWAAVRMVWGVTGIDSWAGQAPSAGEYYWPKGANNASPKKWVAFGDHRTLYLMLDGTDGYPASSYNGVPMGIFAFGDFSGDAAGGAYDCMLSASGTSATSSPSSMLGTEQLLYAPPVGAIAPRSFSGVGGPVAIGVVGMRNGSLVGGLGPVFPSPVDRGVRLHAPVLLTEANATFSYPIRGALRGLANPLAAMPVAQVHLTPMVVADSDRDWMLVGLRQSGSQLGAIAVDMTGPW